MAGGHQLKTRVKQSPKEDGPGSVEPVVEPDFTLGGVGREVRNDVTQAKSRHFDVSALFLATS